MLVFRCSDKLKEEQVKLKDLASLSQEQSNSLEAKLVTIQAQFEQATKARIKSVVMASLSLSHTHAHAHAHTHARARTHTHTHT